MHLLLVRHGQSENNLLEASMLERFESSKSSFLFQALRDMVKKYT